MRAIVSLLVAALAGTFSTDEWVANIHTVATKTECTLVKFDFIRDTSLLVIPIFLNDSGPYRFLLDTGASHSVLSSRLAEMLNLPRGRTESLNTANASIPVNLRKVDSFRIGDIRIRKPEIAVADFPLMRTLQFDGILGGDYLKSFTVSIDYVKRYVRIENCA